MCYIKNSDWQRWYKRCCVLAHELEAISKGIDPSDISKSREISELAHLAGAYKYLRFAQRELLGGYQTTLTFNDIEGSN